MGSCADTITAFHHHSLSVTAQPPPSVSFSALRASLEAFHRKDDSASLYSPPFALSVGGTSLAVGPGELHLHQRLQLQDADQRRIKDKLQPLLQQPEPRPSSGCSPTTGCSHSGGEASPEARQGGRLPFQRQRQHQLSRILYAWLCLR